MDDPTNDFRRLAIAKTKAGRRPPAVVRAMYESGMTPAMAAAICLTTRDVLKQCWAKGRQFRKVRPWWADALSSFGVPRHLWPTHG